MIKLLRPGQFKTEWIAPGFPCGFSVKTLRCSGELLGKNILPEIYLWQMKVKFCQMFDSKMLKHIILFSSQQWYSLPMQEKRETEHDTLS